MVESGAKGVHGPQTSLAPPHWTDSRTVRPLSLRSKEGAFWSLQVMKEPRGKGKGSSGSLTHLREGGGGDQT